MAEVTIKEKNVEPIAFQDRIESVTLVLTPDEFVNIAVAVGRTNGVQINKDIEDGTRFSTPVYGDARKIDSNLNYKLWARFDQILSGSK